MTLAGLWGAGRDLDALQMTVRSVATFVVALALVRISGRRSFARRSAFDNIIVIILGTVLGRPIYGASPFWPVVAGSTALVVVHRLIGVAASRVSWIERLAKGRPHVLWCANRYDQRAMTWNEISQGDLESALRTQLHRVTLDGIGEIRVEPSGELTVTERQARGLIPIEGE